MPSQVKDPLTLIKGVVSARHRGAIQQPGYLEALRVLERHFDVYQQRLGVMNAPASFEEGEVMLNAAGQGLERLVAAVGRLQQLDPNESPDEAVAIVKEAESGYNLLLQLREINQEKAAEFEEAYREFQENDEFGYEDY